MRSRKFFGGLAVVAAVGMVACGGASSAVPATTSAVSASSPAQTGASVASAAGKQAPIRIVASQNVTSNAPVWLAKEAGLFQKNGLNVEVQNVNAQLAMKQLVTGDMDALVAGAAESITARAAGSPVQIVAVLQTNCDMMMTVPSSITAIEQVRGKTVAVINKPSTNGVCTVADLKKQGMLAGKDYKLIETGSAGTYGAVVGAMQSHNVDAGALQPDFARKLSAAGEFHVLYDLGTEPGLLTAASSLTFPTSFIQQRPGDVQKVVDTLLQAQTYFKQNRPAAEAILRDTFKVTDPADLDYAVGRLSALFPKDVTPRKDLFPDLIESLSQVQDSVKNLDLDSLLVTRFTQDAANRGLTAS